MLIRRITVERFRSIENLTWLPQQGVNCLLGPGDGGKTTLLDAISLLFQPFNPEQASELDYHNRNFKDGFRIEAVIAATADDAFVQERFIPPLRGWKDNKLTDLPDEQGAETVLVCQVQGDEQLDISYSILALNGEPASFGPSLRRKFGLARLSAMDSANRNLRLGVGSMLARYFRGTGAGGALAEVVKNASADLDLPTEVEQRLEQLRIDLKSSELPDDLGFGVLPALGTNLSGMLALSTGKSASSAIPLANSGSGTRNTVLLELAVALADTEPLLVADEPERGLEPYRQRWIALRLKELVGEQGQAFIATHSPAVLKSLEDQPIWRVGSSGIQTLSQALRAVIQKHPDALFCRLAVVCEGATEQGLLGVLLRKKLDTDLDALGVELVDGNGQPEAIQITNALRDAHIPAAGFLDSESKHEGARKKLASRTALFVWEQDVDIERHLARVANVDELVALVELAAELNNLKSTTYYAQVRDHLKTSNPNAGGTTFAALLETTTEPELRGALGYCMHQHGWFKSYSKGKVLGEYILASNFTEFDEQLNEWLKRLRELVEL